MIAICKQCGKEFKAIPARVKAGKDKFCCKDCYSQWLSENTKGENSPSWKGGPAKVICIECGREFYSKVATVKLGNVKYCSRKCKNLNISRNLRGNKRYNWKGNKSEKAEIRTSFKYKCWRSEIFKRDNFTCQKCGNKGGILEAHHIMPFCKLIDNVKTLYPDINLVVAALGYSPLWDINNGITLCRECHRKIGRKGLKC